MSGLRPRQFLSALLRLAMLRYERPPDAGAREPTLAPRLALLLRQYVIPNALKSDVDQFRKMLNRQEVRDVLRVHREPLQRVFRFYADGTVGAPAEEPGAPATPKKKEGKKKGKQGRRSVVAEQPKRPPAAPPMAFNPLGIPASSRIAPEAGFVSEGGPPASAMRLPAMSVAAFIRLLSDARVLDYGLDDATARKLFANVQKVWWRRALGGDYLPRSPLVPVAGRGCSGRRGARGEVAPCLCVASRTRYPSFSHDPAPSRRRQTPSSRRHSPPSPSSRSPTHTSRSTRGA